MLSRPTDNLALEARLVPHFGPSMFMSVSPKFPVLVQAGPPSP